MCPKKLIDYAKSGIEFNATKYCNGVMQYFLDHESECLISCFISLLGSGLHKLVDIWLRERFGTVPFVMDIFNMHDMKMYHASITCYSREMKQ